MDENIQNLPARDNYFLLPFKFKSIGDNQEILTNIVGDYIICPHGTAQRLTTGDIQQSDDIYNDLLSKFIIGEGDISTYTEILTLRYRTKKAFLNDFTSLHIFVITLRCNQSCIYCQVSSKCGNQKGLDISTEALDASILLMFNSPSKDLTVEFQGGEPLLAFNKIKYAVDKINILNNDYKRKISFVICTNLQSISDEILTFVQDNKILISTSFDGPRELHNYNRPFPGQDSYGRFLSNLSKCRTFLENDRISALITISKKSLTYTREIVDEYIDQGFTGIFLRPINRYGQAVKNADSLAYSTNEFIDFYKNTLAYIIDKNLSGNNIREEYSAIILRKILTPFSVGFTDLESPNGIINSVLVYNYDGFVYPSDEARMISESGDKTLQLGNVLTDSYRDIVFGDKARELSNYWSNECLAGCSECPYLTYCGADPIGNYNTHNDFYGRRYGDDFCNYNMSIIEHLLTLLGDDDERIRSILYSWAFNSTPVYLGQDL